MGAKYQQGSLIAAIFVDILEGAHSAIAGYYHLPGMVADIRKCVSWNLQSNEGECFTFNDSSLMEPGEK